MGKEKDFDQVLRRHPCVDLGGGDPSVAEHYLNRPEVGSALHHVGRGRVAQGVGRNRLRVDPDVVGVQADDSKG